MLTLCAKLLQSTKLHNFEWQVFIKFTNLLTVHATHFWSIVNDFTDFSWDNPLPVTCDNQKLNKHIIKPLALKEKTYLLHMVSCKTFLHHFQVFLKSLNLNCIRFDFLIGTFARSGSWHKSKWATWQWFAKTQQHTKLEHLVLKDPFWKWPPPQRTRDFIAQRVVSSYLNVEIGTLARLRSYVRVFMRAGMTWHATSQLTTVAHPTSPHNQPHYFSPGAASWHQNKSHRNSRGLVDSKETVSASRWSVALRIFYRQTLSLLYSSFFFWNFCPQLARNSL